jgi:hypothetical protein
MHHLVTEECIRNVDGLHAGHHTSLEEDGSDVSFGGRPSKQYRLALGERSLFSEESSHVRVN